MTKSDHGSTYATYYNYFPGYVDRMAEILNTGGEFMVEAQSEVRRLERKLAKMNAEMHLQTSLIKQLGKCLEAHSTCKCGKCAPCILIKMVEDTY